MSFEFLDDQVAFSFYQEFRNRMIHKKRALQTLDTMQSKKSKGARGDFALDDNSEPENAATFDPTVPAFNPHKLVDSGPVSVEDTTTTFHLKGMDFERVFQLEQILQNCFGRGPSLGLPIHNMHIRIISGRFTKTNTTNIGMGMCLNQVIMNCLSNCGPTVLEPVMKLIVYCPSGYTQTVISDILRRFGKVNDFTDESGGKEKVVTRIVGQIPLSNTIGYSTWLRGETRGEAKFS